LLSVFRSIGAPQAFLFVALFRNAPSRLDSTGPEDFTHRRSASARRCCDLAGTPLLNGKQTRSRLRWRRRKLVRRFREKKVRASAREGDVAPRRYNSRVFNKLRRCCNYAIYTEPRPTEGIIPGMPNQPLAIPSILGRRSTTARGFRLLFRFLPRKTASENFVLYKGLTQNHRY
jgi:hypothetical protein